jgi:hypothetical protein
MQHVQRSCRLGGNTNSSFLVLIPKEANMYSFSIFNPIYLFNASYKIMPKIMNMRLKTILSKIIFENQGGFVQKRQIFAI